MDIKKFAPVIIPTLNRYEHFKQCVESLAKCTYAEDTVLIVGLDFPPDKKYVEGWKKISEYVETISGFKEIIVLRREFNYGAVNNIINLLGYARCSNDRFILSEDDNVFSPNFLDYMNKGLDAFKDNPKVFGICGYNYVEIDTSEFEGQYYYSHEMSAWGWGSWFNEKYDRVYNVVAKPDYYMSLIKTVPFSRFLKNRARLCKIVTDIGFDLRLDGRYTCYEWLNDMYSVYPVLSLTRNVGHDGSGEHCVGINEDPYATQKIDSRRTFDCDFSLPVEYTRKVEKAFSCFQKESLRTTIKNVLLLVILKVFVKIRRY